MRVWRVGAGGLCSGALGGARGGRVSAPSHTHPIPTPRFADKLGIGFLETSAKTSVNVESAFNTMASQIKARMAAMPTAGSGSKGTVRAGQSIGQSQGGCC